VRQLAARQLRRSSTAISSLTRSLSLAGIKLVGGERSDRGQRVRASLGFRLLLEELEPRVVLSASGAAWGAASAAPPWQSVGPSPITGASDVLPASKPSSQDVGAVNALAVDPYNPSHVYAATVDGGIWQTRNYTAANPIWTTTSDHLPSLAISAIAISPVYGNVIFAGTGNYSSTGGGDVFAPGAGDNAAGIYRSLDGGASWSVINPNGIFDGLRIRRVVPTTLNGGMTIFAATTDTAVDSKGTVVRGGVYRSDDGGTNWTRLSGGSSGLPNTGVTDLVANPANPFQLFTAIAGQAGGNNPDAAPNPVPAGTSGVYRLDMSVPRATWQNITGAAMAGVVANASRVELSISKAAGNPIWVTTIDSINTSYSDFCYSGVFRATNTKSPVWASIAPPDILVDGTGDGKGCMLSDPNDPNTLYVGGDLRDSSPYTAYVARFNYQANTWTNITPNTPFAHVTQVARNAGVATVTTDQRFEVGQTAVIVGATNKAFNGTFAVTASTRTGSSFTFSFASAGPNIPATAETTAQAFNQQFAPGTAEPIQIGVASGAHPDTRNLQFGLGGDLLLACDGGVYRCTNPQGTAAQIQWSSINGSLANTEFYQVALDNQNNTNPADDVILGASQDNGASQRASNGTWVEAIGGDGVVVLADPASHTHYFAAANYYMNTLTGNTTSAPPGTIVGTTSYLNTANGDNPAESLPFNVVFVLNQGDVAHGVNPARILLAGTKKTLYLSSDKGNTYTSIGGLNGATPKPVPNINGDVTAIAFGSAANPNAAYVCLSDGSIVFTPNINGAQGGFGAPVHLAGGEVGMNIVIDPSDANTAYVITPTKVFMTKNGGTSWTSITDNLGQLLKPYILQPSDYNSFFANGRSIALFTNGTVTTSDDWLLVGEPGGVFRRMVQPSPSLANNTWQAFGAGTTLPNVFVTSLVYDSKSDVLLAGTLGRGAWLLKNVSSSLNTSLYNGNLVITGTNGNDQIQIVSAWSDRNAVRVSVNGKSLGEFAGITGQIIVNGLGGNDRIDVAPSVRLPVILMAAGPNSGNQANPLVSAHAQVFSAMADDGRCEADTPDTFLDTVARTTFLKRNSHLGRTRNARHS